MRYVLASISLLLGDLVDDELLLNIAGSRWGRIGHRGGWNCSWKEGREEGARADRAEGARSLGQPAWLARSQQRDAIAIFSISNQGSDYSVR